MPDICSAPLPLRSVRVTDPFWSRVIDLIRTAVIPYQWDALNDRIPDAEKSWWAHNMRAAALAVRTKKNGKEYSPVQQNCGFTIYPGKISTTNTFRLCALGAIDEQDIRDFFAVFREALDKYGVSVPVRYDS